MVFSERSGVPALFSCVSRMSWSACLVLRCVQNVAVCLPSFLVFA